MDLLALADFTLVARHGGFGKAARAARRPKATLSRRVSELEVALDLRLFERGQRDLKLTEEGRALAERAGALLAELEETTIEIASGSVAVRGRLRISAPLLFSQTAMGSLAAGFAQRHPDVQLEVTTDDRAVDMVEEGYDLVIRVNPAADDALVGRPFLHDRLIVVAAPDLAPLAGVIFPAVVRDRDVESSWTIDTADGQRAIPINPVLRLSSLVMIRDAVLLGAGVARLPLSLVSRDIARRRLIAWGDVRTSRIALWALYPSRRLLNARVAAFLDYLRQSFPNGTAEELATYLDDRC
ncbi:LysR family transcriptional regulator [Sphingomonas corticis]|jgi:DNA-binding transcriptional LysR family regulator|uniref:LysR family transcriptional regulator n=1 Tax=Sphingomonas corticis TaxID=2722791 RepID=A0ABX1CSH5_9SPHN|nr:LysR family transcriptional regulator [Sphingomonas corticis]NJR78737.1 LysR family transcriptional regulator [Sphingomonas corticis]